jgi:hypothetical protein
MKRLWIVGFLVLLLGMAAYFWTANPGRTPAGQSQLREIKGESLDALKSEFNQAAAGYRVIVLLSPT